MDKVINIAEMESLAQRRVPAIVFDYLAGGAEDELTLRRNREVFERYEFQPRVVRGANRPNLSIPLFGQRLATPFLIGPTGLNGLLQYGADLMLAHAAHNCGTAFTLSTAANVSIEDVAKQAQGQLWFQLYPWGDKEVVRRLIERARRSGYAVLVVTADALTPGKRERDLRNGFQRTTPVTAKAVLDGALHPRWLAGTWLRGRGMPRFENVAEFVRPDSSPHELAKFTRSQQYAGLQWDDLARMKELWQGPVLVKGICCAEDAVLAKRAGMDGIVVSNHGGRQLDGSPATLAVLPAIVSAAGEGFPVLVDSGFRRGTDIVKALALGAQAVLLGRATLFGVAAGGQAGAERALTILRDEVERTLAFIGATSPGQLTPNVLRVGSA